MPQLFSRHQERLEQALHACATRTAWTPFQESPSRRLHPEGAHEAGKSAFEASLGRSFPLTLPAEIGRIGAEISPYTQAPLGIDYPRVEVEPLYQAMRAALPAWRDASVEMRVGVCLEILDQLAQRVFETTYATMHTTGQSFMMAFAGSGANSLDRGLEGIAYAYKAMRDIPTQALFVRRFGHGQPVEIEKRYRLMPRGISVVISCGSYPAWNAYPAIFANLATGNPVVVKPHPHTILPMAIAVKVGRDVLSNAGFDPNLLTLAADTPQDPITLQLLQHPQTAIIDFTGSQRFGRWIEEHCRHALVYTETAGCNAVILESTNDSEALLHALAQSLCLFSSQMCTAPQNLFIPRQGLRTPDGMITVDDFAARLVQTIDKMTHDPTYAAGLCGALHSPVILDTLQEAHHLAQQHAKLLRPSAPYAHPDFPNARTATPLLLQVDAKDHAIYQREYFGPIAFLITTPDREQALERAAHDAKTYGSIASYAYSTDAAFLAQIQDAFFDAGASIGCNLLHQLPINFTAAYSDFHVTGLNPAGNACLTDLAFVTQRFRIVQSKVEHPTTK